MMNSKVVDAMSKKPPSNGMLSAYTCFFGSALVMYHTVANGEFSSILTLAVMMQCLAFSFLVLQTLSTGHVAGISARALALDAGALGCRLSSTVWLNGYLPVDASGDWLYQAVDICSLAMVCWLIWRVVVDKNDSYQKAEDSFPAAPVALASLVLAMIFHADMNARPVFDTLWMTGLFVSVVAVLPQLWLISRSGGSVDALTSHYVAAMAVSRALSGIFMWHARFDITCEPWLQGMNHAIWAILIAHGVHVLLLGDFAYYYVQAVARQGLTARLQLINEACNV